MRFALLSSKHCTWLGSYPVVRRGPRSYGYKLGAEETPRVSQLMVSSLVLRSRLRLGNINFPRKIMCCKYHQITRAPLLCCRLGRMAASDVREPGGLIPSMFFLLGVQLRLLFIYVSFVILAVLNAGVLSLLGLLVVSRVTAMSGREDVVDVVDSECRWHDSAWPNPAVSLSCLMNPALNEHESTHFNATHCFKEFWSDTRYDGFPTLL